MSAPIIVRSFTSIDYADALTRMRQFTASRTVATSDELWLMEHPAVFTQGLAGKAEHLLAPGDIAVVKTERGGQVTFHGPGQVVAYLLLDLPRRQLSVRCLVQVIEDAAIELLDRYKVAATRKTGAPGVYIREPTGAAGAKIAALGIKVSRGCTYHGVALNVDMDLEPFSRINPCGYPGLAVTDLSRQLSLTATKGTAAERLTLDVAAIADEFAQILVAQLMAFKESRT